MRILSGRHKGRKLLPPPRSAETRPVTGLVKKSLFGMLGGLVEDATVLDLYCGTGTLGLEALSRGAGRCCFAERDRAVCDRLRRNIETLGESRRCTVWYGDVRRRLRRWLAELDGNVDMAFVDPPYAQVRRWAAHGPKDSWPAIDDAIFSPLAERLSAGGRVVLRLPRRVQPPEQLAALEIERTRRYGDMCLLLLGSKRKSE